MKQANMFHFTFVGERPTKLNDSKRPLQMAGKAIYKPFLSTKGCQDVFCNGQVYPKAEA